MTIDDIRRAADGLKGVAVRTPLVEIPDLSELAGFPVYLKQEQRQPTGAFKLRGAWTAISRLEARDRSRGVITYSSGNHGQGVAFAAHRMGVRAVIVMPETAPSAKVEGVRRWGGEIRVAAVEPEGAAGYAAAVQAGRPVRLPQTASIADGLLPLSVGTLTFQHLFRRADPVTVSDSAIIEATRWLYLGQGLTVEPSGAATTGALRSRRLAVRGPTVLVVSGGNIDPARIPTLGDGLKA